LFFLVVNLKPWYIAYKDQTIQ